MRQTNVVGAAVLQEQAVSSRESFRLNPAERHQVIRMEVRNSALVGEASIELGDTLVVEGKLKCGLPTKVSCTASALRGVAARITLTEENEVMAELVLLNRDASLNLVVARSSDMEELAADWQMWAKRYNLPLILIEADGYEQMISNRLGSLDIAPSAPRRPDAFFQSRRTRFGGRRKVGCVDSGIRMQGREIIARS